MKQVFIQNGVACMMDVPAPQMARGEVLVQVAYSLISSGTEIAGLRSSGESLLDKARKHPDKVVKAARSLVSEGIAGTMSKVRAQKGSSQPIGDGCSGVALWLIALTL